MSRPRFGRGAIPLLALLVFLVYYGSYLYLARRGEVQGLSDGTTGFLYVLPTDSDNWLELHHKCCRFYAPANAIDRAFGATRDPIRGFTFGLSR
jgi:hypothetical protein